MTYAVALGEMFDGIGFYGPFKEFEDAEDWVGLHAGNTNSWIVELGDTDIDGNGRSPLVLANVDFGLLAEQHRVLADLLELVRDDDAFMDVTCLDGLLDMIGDTIPDVTMRMNTHPRT